MSSKLAYLSKYSNDISIQPDTYSSDEKQSKKVKKKKKKSKSKSSKSSKRGGVGVEEGAAGGGGGSTTVYDDIYDPNIDIGTNSNRATSKKSKWNDCMVQDDDDEDVFDNVNNGHAYAEDGEEDDGPTIVHMDGSGSNDIIHSSNGNGTNHDSIHHRRKQYDSDDDNGSGNGNGNERSRSNRKRYDSDDDDYNDSGEDRRRSKKKRKKSRSSRKRHDSETDEEDNRVEMGRRKRHDSDDDDDNVSSKRSKRRHDSDDEEDETKHRNHQKVTRLKRRHDSDDEEDRLKDFPRSRKRLDSDDDSDSPNMRRRHDSDLEDDDGQSSTSSSTSRYNNKTSLKERSLPKRKHYDSDDNYRKSDNDHDESPSMKDGREKTKAGYTAGLHNISSFQKEHKEIALKTKKRQATIQDHDDGRNQQTVYRDKHGRKIDNAELQEAVEKAEREREERKARGAVVNEEWNIGSVQKQQQEEYVRMKNDMENSTFARSIQDDGLEHFKKQQLRDGDPMAKYAIKQSSSIATRSESRTQRPIYKGPQPKPNRFNIRPGYRWDGIDRGNGFEDDVLAQMFSKGRKKEEAYRYSCSDM